MAEPLDALHLGVGALSAAFVRRWIAIGPGATQPLAETEWQGTLVVVEQGEIELECVAGGRRRFGTGDIIWTDGLDVRGIHNPARGRAVLLTVSRRATATRER